MIPNTIYLQVEDEYGVMPEEGWTIGNEITWCVDRVNDSDLVYVAESELKRAAELTSCGHPPGCMESTPNAEGTDVRAAAAGTTSYCGWCAVETDLAGSIEFNRDVATENLKLEAERDGLRERLNELRVMIAEQVKLTARYKRERNALRDKYGELPPGESPWCYPGTECNALRERLKAAEGLAEALQKPMEKCPWCRDKEDQGYTPYAHTTTCPRQQALAAWKAAND